jgi:pullulanase/glycogen debranching enzyme
MLAASVAGSADLFCAPARPWTSSINYVTSHDGFTLWDLVSFAHKHNEANGQDNADGTDDNRSWNCGVEGETDEAEVLSLRTGDVRAMLATLLVSRGVPMLLGGDELGRTQGGNNNAYCQDNETSWLDWEGADHDLLGFAARALALRRAHPAVRSTAPGVAPIRWLRPDGAPMGAADLEAPSARCVTLHATEGDDAVVAVLNACALPVTCTLPGDATCAYVEELSSSDPTRRGERRRGGDAVEVPARSVLVLALDAVAAPTAPLG